MKKKTFVYISLFIILILNIVGLYFVDIMEFGWIISILVLSIILANKESIGYTILYTSLFTFIFLLFGHLIDFVFNYERLAFNGQIVTTSIKIIAGLLRMVVAAFIALIIGLVFRLWNKKNKASC